MKGWIMPIVGLGWLVLCSLMFWHWANSADERDDDDDFGGD